MFFGLIAALLSLFRPDMREYAPLQAIYTEIYKEAKSEIDRSKRKEIRTIVKGLEKNAVKYNKNARAISDNFWELDKQYSISEEEYLAVLDSIDTISMEVAEEFLSTRKALKETISPEEWTRIHDKVERYVEKTVKKKKKSMK